MKKLTSLLIGLALAACSSTPSTPNKAQSIALKSDAPLNIIMFVADGMGPAFTTGYRYYADDPATTQIEDTWFDRHLVGMVTTYPASESGLVTDSAASATAMAAGVKSFNGAIGVDSDKVPVESVLHRAKSHGMKTGIAVTSQIVHATPAAYIAHNESRQNYNAIADHYFDLRFDGDFWVDVMLGGGTDYFVREDRNLAAQFSQAGFAYVTDYAALDKLEPQQRVLGLFDKKGLPWALDDPQPQRLLTLTKAAVNHLENPDGFFLLVEASQVDWAGHGNDIAGAMAEMQDAHDTLLWLETYQQANPNTLIIMTADHSTGGVTIAANGEYRWSPQLLHQVKSSPYAIINHLKANSSEIDRVQYVQDQLGFELEEQEIVALNQLDLSQGIRQLAPVITTMIDNRTNTGWTTSGHTAIDVQIFAQGPQFKRFEGQLDNTDIAKQIFAILAMRQEPQ